MISLPITFHFSFRIRHGSRKWLFITFLIEPTAHSSFDWPSGSGIYWQTSRLQFLLLFSLTRFSTARKLSNFLFTSFLNFIFFNNFSFHLFLCRLTQIVSFKCAQFIGWRKLIEVSHTTSWFTFTFSALLLSTNDGFIQRRHH